MEKKKDDLHVLFGKSLQGLRKAHSLSQEQLAEKCGITQQYIGHIEQGTKNPSLALLIKIAQALQVSPAKLLSFTALTGKEHDDWQTMLSMLDKGKQRLLLKIARSMLK